MLLLKEKEINELEEGTYVSAPKRRTMPSRAGYYANVQQAANAPAKKEDCTIELIRGGKSIASSVDAADDLDINVSNLTETDLKQYEKMSSNLVPSGATMRTLTARQAEEVENKDEAIAVKVNKKGLIMLLVYAVVIIGIFAAIIINAVSLVNLMNTTSALEIELNTIDTNLESLNEELKQALNPDMIYDRAVNELEMVTAGEVNGIINVYPTVPEQSTPEGSTNLYDWALDTGLIGIIAGAVVLLSGCLVLLIFIGKKGRRNKDEQVL